jgi:hypothetical protein
MLTKNYYLKKKEKRVPRLFEVVQYASATPPSPLIDRIGKICLPYREKKTKREGRGDHCNWVRLEPNKTTVSSLDSLGDARLLENPVYGAGGSCAVSVRGPRVRDPRGFRPGRIHARGRAGADTVRA